MKIRIELGLNRPAGCLRTGLWKFASHSHQRCNASSTASGWDSATRRSAGADADERGELGLAETEFFAHSLGIRQMQSGAAGGFLFAAKNGAAFLDVGDELLE
jgi:hypothetical protein